MKVLSAAGLLASVLLLSNLPAQAQVQAGLRLGANASTVKGDQVATASTGISYQAGIFTRFNLGDLTLQPELLFTSRKYDFTQTLGEVGAFYPSEKKINSTYLDLPVYVNIELAKKLQLLAGPVFSMRMAGKQTLSDGKASDGHDFELFDIGIGGGLSYVFGNGIDLSARGQLGFLPVYTKVNQNLLGPNEPDVKNLSFQFTVGLPISRSGEGDVKPKTYKEAY